jgi:hypothetical protein
MLMAGKFRVFQRTELLIFTRKRTSENSVQTAALSALQSSAQVAANGWNEPILLKNSVFTEKQRKTSSQSASWKFWLRGGQINALAMCAALTAPSAQLGPAVPMHRILAEK